MTDAQVYLKSIGDAEARIELKTRQLQNLRDRMLCLSAPMDKEQVSHTKNVGVMADTIALILDMEAEIDQQTSAFLQKKRDAIRMMSQIPPESAELLAARYFDRKTFEEIGRIMFITKRHAIRKHKEALARFQAVLDQENMSLDVT